MSDGIERAAQRILDRGVVADATREDARVILDANAKAIEDMRAIRDRHQRPTNQPDDPWCNHCDRPWPCVDYHNAVAALACLQGDDA